MAKKLRSSALDFSVVDASVVDSLDKDRMREKKNRNAYWISDWTERRVLGQISKVVLPAVTVLQGDPVSTTVVFHDVYWILAF